MDFLVNIDVEDLEEAVRFYTAAFGLHIGRRFSTFGVEMLGGPAPIYLLVKEAGTPAAETTSQVRGYVRHWTPVHLDFVVENIKTLYKKQFKQVHGLRSRLRRRTGTSWRLWLIRLATGSVLCSFSVVAMMRLRTN